MASFSAIEVLPRVENKLVDLSSWDHKPYGVVSLLDMLRFAAEKFYKLSEELSRITGVEGLPPLIGGEGTPMSETAKLVRELGLQSASDQMERILTPGTNIKPDDLFADLQRRVHDDLKRRVLYIVESDRTQFCEPKWMSGSEMSLKFPTAFRELQSAGRSYAFGEGPASAFHSMRALEVGLGVLASKFGIDFQHTNWQPAIEEIESKIRDIGKNQIKTQKIRDDEKFFGGLARHFIFLKDGWRNHVMHVRETYTDREARQMLDHVTDLLTDMSTQLAEQTSPV
jgi:hypothetical protein